MQKPILTLKPDIVNALFPMLFRNISYSLIIAAIIYGFSFVLRAIDVINYSNRIIIFALIVFLLVISITPLIIRLIILANTKYYFFKSHVLKEFKFFSIRRHSLPYNKIVNITSHISVWDRICKAGDVILHTAENKNPDLVLSYVNAPRKIERGLYNLISKQHTQRK